MYQRYGKRCLDVILSLIALIVLSPLFLLIALAIRLDSPGRVIFSQKRVGMHKKLFSIYKFRTMRSDTPHDVPTNDLAGSTSYITPVGRFLRRWKLDELPQLWNVVLGRMSFVGPRPDVPGYADRLQGADRRILELLPGITGPATLLFRDEERLLALARDPRAFNDAVVYPEKIRLNREYLETGGFWRDLGYILATVWPALARRTGWEARLGLDYAAFFARLEREAVRY